VARSLSHCGSSVGEASTFYSCHCEFPILYFQLQFQIMGCIVYIAGFKFFDFKNELLCMCI